MRAQSWRDSLAELSIAARARPAQAQSWRAWLAELLGLAALIAIVVVAATWIARPQLYVEAASPGAQRFLVGFGPAEQNAQGTFRWAFADAGLRLFGFEQRAPIVVRARLTAVREPGQPPAQPTVDAARTRTTFAISPSVWRNYVIVLPAPPRGDEAPLLTFHTPPTVFKNDPRQLGFVLSRIEVTQQPITPGQRLPDPSRAAFLVLLGLLVHLALRRAGLASAPALSIVLALTLALGVAIAIAPGKVAYWLPNLWLALLAGWLALLAPPLVRGLRRGSGVRGPALVPLGLIAIAGAQALLPLQQPWSSALGWALLFAGGVLLVAGLPAPRLEAVDEPSSRAVTAALVACTALALALRLLALDQLPLGMWRDEARHGLLALRILHDPTFRPVYVPVVADIPALLFYLAAGPIAAFGPHPWTVRLVPALAGALTPLALYWMARSLFGVRAALLAAALLAVSVWHIALSRLAFAATLGPLLTVLALGLIWRALQAGPRRRGYLLAGLAGACGGLAVYAYHPSRLTPLVGALAVVALLGIDWRAWRSAAPRLILTAAVLLAVLLPLINYTLDNPGNFSRRLDQTFIFDAATSDGHAPAPLVEQNARLIAGMWNEHGDENGRHNLSGAPMLDPLSGVAFVAGACLLLARLRDRRAQIVLIWLGVMLIPGLLSGQAPHAARTVEAIAPTILLAAVGGAALLDWALRERGWIANASLRWGVALGLLACVLALNGWRYFVAWPATPPAYLEFYVGQTHIGEAAQQLARAPELNRYQVFVSANLDDSDVIDYLTFGSDVRKFDGSRLWLGPGDQALLILRGNRPADDQARRILGAGALMIGEGPRSPVSGRPEFVIYARDAAAAPAVARVLARLLAAAPWS